MPFELGVYSKGGSTLYGEAEGRTKNCKSARKSHRTICRKWEFKSQGFLIEKTVTKLKWLPLGRLRLKVSKGASRARRLISGRWEVGIGEKTRKGEERERGKRRRPGGYLIGIAK